MSDIRWPEKFTPGNTDNFVSNEVIVKGLSAVEVWPFLNDTQYWPVYYNNASDITVGDGESTELSAGAKFRFTTFGIPLHAEVTEYEPPALGRPARLAWRAWKDGSEEEAIEIFHPFLIEDLPGDRVRVLTQESQFGEPARKIHGARPNPMVNAHQDWLEGLVNFAKKRASR